MPEPCPDCNEISLCYLHSADLPVVEAPDADPLADARRLLADHEQQQTEACLAELEAVLAKYGRRLQITEPKISIVPL